MPSAFVNGAMSNEDEIILPDAYRRIRADQPVMLSVTKPPTLNTKAEPASPVMVTSIVTLSPARPAAMHFPPFGVSFLSIGPVAGSQPTHRAHDWAGHLQRPVPRGRLASSPVISCTLDQLAVSSWPMLSHSLLAWGSCLLQITAKYSPHPPPPRRGP